MVLKSKSIFQWLLYGIFSVVYICIQTDSVTKLHSLDLTTLLKFFLYHMNEWMSTRRELYNTPLSDNQNWI